MLENKKYLKAANKYSKALRDTPLTPLEEAAYWVEFMLRNPDVDLEGPAGGQGFFVRHSLDVIFTITFALILLIYVVWKIEILLIKLVKMIFNLGGKKEQNSVPKSKKKN